VESEPTVDPFDESTGVVREANDKGIPLKLVGGQAVRLLCPDFPHRARNDQDMDFASVSSAKAPVLEFLSDHGFVSDRKFNTMHGHRQMYFTTADGKTSVDVIMDQLNMCHVLDFSDRIDRMPYTLDVADLLLSKLQIVELNEKDLHDILHLLSGFEVKAGDEPGTIGLDRIGEVVRQDWGWWRTVTGNLDKVASLAEGERKDMVPEGRSFEPAEQARALRKHADDVPKTMKWRVRSKVGDRVQWYQLPEEVGH
jgi:arylsulfatase A-like enzyme